MRKSIVSGSPKEAEAVPAGPWLNLTELASAELTSEDAAHPFEQAVTGPSGSGWKASTPGPQTIRIVFDHPQAIRRVHLHFKEEHTERSQEIALFATSRNAPRKELVRQQWSFSPQGSTSEVEDYYFHLADVTALELEIDPGRHNKEVFATLQSFRIG